MKTHLPQLKAAIYRANEELTLFCNIIGCTCYEKGSKDKHEYKHLPIHLEHILRAIRQQGDKSIGIDEEGNILAIVHISAEWEFTGIVYNLAKSFEDQEPEVLEFLYQLLCKE